MNPSIDQDSSLFNSGSGGENIGQHNLQQQYLSMEQMQWLLKVMSTSDRDTVNAEMRKCSGEMAMTRGLPLAAGVMASMYIARKRLPAQYHFGPKGWPFYALIGFGSFTLASLLSTNACTVRIKPILLQMYQKYNAKAPRSSHSYEELRAANRARFAGGANQSLRIAGPQGKITTHSRQLYEEGRAGDSRQFESPLADDSAVQSPEIISGDWSNLMDDESNRVISGTPSDEFSQPTVDYTLSNASKKNQYGDFGYS